MDEQKKGVIFIYIYMRIKDLREDHDKNQQTIAELLQITQPQYYLYESGKREMPMHLMIQLADYYNVSLDYLAGRTNEPKNPNL